MSGVIYKITCNITNKSYIGQATALKYKNGKSYNYGMKGRWNDHVSTSKYSTKPLHNAIREHGRAAFTIEEIEASDKIHLDALEAKWIEYYNTLVPNGYNVASHSRNRHHLETAFYEFYLDKVNRAVIRPIRKGGVFKMVYVVLYLKNGKQKRITFGQQEDYTFERALHDAKQFINDIKCPYEEETHNNEEIDKKYKKKLDQFIGKNIVRVRITTASSLIALYIYDDSSQMTRICFGGKHINHDDAYLIANRFTKLLNLTSECIIEDSYQSPQQVDAS